MGLLSSDVESIEIKFDQVNYKFINRKMLSFRMGNHILLEMRWLEQSLQSLRRMSK